MGKVVVRWLRSPGGVLAVTLLGALLVTVLVALAGNMALDLFHRLGEPASVARRLRVERELFFLSSVVVWLFVVLVVAVLGRLWLSVGVVAVLTGLIGFADQRKQELVMEPLYPSDLTLGADLGFLSQMVGVGVLVAALLAVVLVLAGAVLLGRFLGRRFPRPNLRTRPRLAWGFIAGRVVLAVATVSSLLYVMQFHQPGNNVRAAYEASGVHWRPWNQSKNYTDNGLVAGLLYNLPMPAMPRPHGYGEAAMKRLVEKYSAAAAKINEQRNPSALEDVNVVSVLSESFSDPTRFKRVQLAEDPIPFTRELMGRTTSGNMLVAKYGGGTANTEFEVLTGMSTSQFRPQMTTPYQMLIPQHSDFPSAVRFFESRGLTTTAMHSYTSALYRRPLVYDLLGFDEVVFEDGMSHKAAVDKSPFISDKATFQEVVARLREAEDPTFMNVVTMQNHYPAAGKYADPIPSTGMPNKAGKRNLEHYAAGLRHSDLALEEFLRSLEASGEKTVVVFYGDHLPPIWGGTGMSRRLRHETPFLVYTNFEKPEAEQLPTTSPVFLMNHVLKAADAPVSPYYALLEKLEREIPAMAHDHYTSPQNENLPWIYLPPRARRLLNDYRLVMFDLAEGRSFSEKAMFKVPESPETRQPPMAD